MMDFADPVKAYVIHNATKKIDLKVCGIFPITFSASFSVLFGTQFSVLLGLSFGWHS